MAGMLAGVETARRRRIHQTSSSSSGPLLGIGSSPSSRRSSFSLLCPSSSSWQRNSSAQQQVDDKLGQLAREAKRRLDERLRAQRKSQIPRNNSDVSEEIRGGRMEERELRTEVFGGWKKNGGSSNSKRLIGSWAKLGWKQWEQQECAVCLEEFKVGENLVNLPCAHRFHSRCLLPWLQTSSHCPCCRTSIFPSEHQ